MRVLVAIPDSLGAQIDAAALESERSRSGQIAYFVREGMRATGIKPSPDRVRRRRNTDPDPDTYERAPRKGHASSCAPDPGGASPECVP